MTDRKNGSQRVGARPVGRAPSAAERVGISGTDAVDLHRVIRGACRGFALAADWRQVSYVAPRAGDGGAKSQPTGYRLSENHEGLHSGRYISVSVLRAAKALAIKGGYYDGYRQPRTVYRESMLLNEVTAKALGCLLTDLHDRLSAVDWEQVT